MTGQEHYREAERLMQSIASKPYNVDERSWQARMTVVSALAQVHATLALTAATARRTQSAMFTTSREWLEVIGE